VREAIRAGMQSRALPLLIGLLLVTAVLLAGDYAHRYSQIDFFTQDERWDVDVDRAYIEQSGYLQLILAAALLLKLAWRPRLTPVFAGWAIALIVLLADDYVGLHERAGAGLEDWLNLPAVLGLRARDLGELLYWGIQGFGVLLLLGVTHRLSPASARRVSWRLVAILILLAGSSAAIDLAHSALLRAGDFVESLPFVQVEAAAEVTGMSAFLVYIVHVLRTRARLPITRSMSYPVADARRSSPPDRI